MKLALMLSTLSVCAALVGCGSASEETTSHDTSSTIVSDTGATIVPSDSRVGPSITWHVVVDAGVSDADVATIDAAMQAWQARVPCEFAYTVTRGSTFVSLSDFPPPEFAIQVQDSTELPMPGASGWGEHYKIGSKDFGGRVQFLTGAPEWDFARAARHELGHAFNLPHSTAPGSRSVMRTSAPFYTEVQAEDVTAYAALWCPT